MTASAKHFRIRTALRDQIRNAEIRTRRSAEGWETQIYLAPAAGADPSLSHEEKMGTSVLFRVDSEQAALDGMMQHLRKYFRLEIEE